VQEEDGGRERERKKEREREEGIVLDIRKERQSKRYKAIENQSVCKRGWQQERKRERKKGRERERER
jgi:hypothetical protein